MGKTLLEKRQAWQGTDHLSDSRQYRLVDSEHTGEISCGGSSGSFTILRCMGMDHHNARVYAIGYILSVSFGDMPVRNMEDVLQM